MINKKNFIIITFLFLVLFPISIFSKQTLEIWIMPNGANPQGILEDILKDFEKQNNVKVNVKVLDWGVAWAKISQALEKGEGPDILQLGTTWTAYFASKGYLTILNKKLPKNYKERFLDISWKTCEIYGDSLVYAVPWFVDVRVLLGNKKYLDSLNITDSLVSTYEGFKEALKRIKKANLKTDNNLKVYPFGFPGKADWNIPHNFAPWIWSEGGSFIIYKNGRWHSNLLNTNTLKGIKKYLSFVLDSLIDPKTLKENTALVAQRFNNGQLAFIINTTEILMQTKITINQGGLKESSIGKSGIYSFRIPRGEKGSISFVGGSNLCIPINNKNNPLALKLLLYLTSKKALDEYTKSIGFLPPDKELLDTWAKDSLYKNVVAAAKEGRAYPSIPKWGLIEALLANMFSEVWSLMDGFYSEERLYKIILSYHKKLETEILENELDTLEYNNFLNKVESISKNKELGSNKKTKNITKTNLSKNSDLYYTITIFLLIIIFGIYFYFKFKNEISEEEDKEDE